MNIKNYTTEEKKKQAAEKWNEEIGKLLPENIGEMAKKAGAIARKREVKSAMELMKVLLIYAATTMSIRMMALSSAALGIAKMSDSAWRKKIIKSVIWLNMVLTYVLPKVRQEGESREREIHLIDGSSVKQEGSGGMVYRMHMDYNLTRGAMEEIKVSDHHTAESVEHHKIRAGDIYIADMGYGKARAIEYITTHKADVIIRVSSNHISLYDAKGEKIDMAKQLRTKKRTVDFRCYMRNGKKQIAVRIVASRLPKDKQADALKRRKKKASQHQSKIKPETLLYAKWVVIATSLDDTYTAKKILEIYRCRWQVELLFKRIKQHLKITKIRPSSSKYAHALILLWLIIWAITERQTVMAEMYIKAKNMDLSRLSPWSLSSFFFIRLKTVIESIWAILIDPFDDIDLIFGFLQDHKSERVSQYFYFHFDNFFAISSSLLS